MAAEDSEETKVEEDQLQKELHKAIEVALILKSSLRKSPASKLRVVNEQTQTVIGNTQRPGFILKDRLHGELEMKLDAKGDNNITGKLVVTDLEDERLTPKTYSMHCLGCSRRL